MPESEAIHTALLFALDLRYVLRSNGSSYYAALEPNGKEIKITDFKGWMKALAELRGTLNERYEPAYWEMLERLTRSPTAGDKAPEDDEPEQAEKSGAGSHAAKAASRAASKDEPGSAERIHKGNLSYGDLGPKEWKRILLGDDYQQRILKDPKDDYPQGTENFAEFALCYRLLQGDTKAALQDYGVPIRTMFSYESGEHMPPWDRFKQIKPYYQPHIYAERLEELLIRNRLSRAEALTETGDIQGATQHLELLPHAYHRQAIDRLIDLEAWEKQENKPHWCEHVRVPTHRGEYLRACCNLLGLTSEEVAQHLHHHNNVICHISHGVVGEHSPTRDQMRDFLLATQDSLLSGQAVSVGKKNLILPAGEGKFFDLECYHRLPVLNPAVGRCGENFAAAVRASQHAAAESMDGPG